MSELEDRLNSLLNDPEQMGQIAQMASRLMGSIAPQEGAPAASGGDDALMGMVGRVLSGLRGDGDKKALMAGLAPYLSEKRRQRLGKALRLSAAVKLAGAAFTELGGAE